LRHMAYAGGWKKFEPLWDVLIRSKQVLHALPVLETILTGFGSRPSAPRRSDVLGSKSRLAVPIAQKDTPASA
ncbi:MAG: hypothetical protein E6I15_01755, partial [Chloroflexi bacterium]